MIKLSDLKEGDFVVAVYEGQQTPGQVKELNREDKEVCITTEYRISGSNQKNHSRYPLMTRIDETDFCAGKRRWIRRKIQ